jgi:hypothetical protein
MSVSQFGKKSACFSAPASSPNAGSAHSPVKSAQRHRSHAQTILAPRGTRSQVFAEIVEHGEKPPFDGRAREGTLKVGDGAASYTTLAAIPFSP